MAFRPFSLGKVGGIYLRSFPAEAEVKLNGKLKRRNIGLFDKGTLLNDILPGEYSLEITAPGFKPWNLPVAVSSSLVTNLPNVVLVPDAASAVTSTPVRDITLVGPTLLLKTASSTQTLLGVAISGEVLAGSEDGAIVLSYSTSTRNYFATDISRATSTSLGRLPGQPTARDAISFQAVPRDDTLFLARGQSSLYLLRTSSGERLQLATSSVAAATTAPGKVLWAAFDKAVNASLLSVYDIPSQRLDPGFEFVPDEVVSLMLLDSGEIFALAKDGSLYSLSFSQSSRVRLARNVRGMALSKDADKLAVLEGQGAKVFFLRENEPVLQATLPDAASAQELTWYRDGEHLFVHYPDRISFWGLEDLGLKNFITVTNTPRAEYEPVGNNLYFIENDTLRRLEFPDT